ncbi:MAG: MFS transporter [Candidatus Omnitrophica bacterium]|nr:MFS transporter [Candidatus Omnitrophota bacterium]
MLKPSVSRVASLVYFAQGALGISAVALPLYMRRLGLSIEDITVLTAIASTPWFIKIIFGALSDSCPIGGKRRKPYIIAYSLISCLGWFLLAVLPFSKIFFALSLIAANLGFAATDVVTDGLIVENSDKDSAQAYQGICWTSRGVGAVIAGFLGGWLASRFDYRLVFVITACLPLVALLASLGIEEASHKYVGLRYAFRPILQSLKLLFRTRGPLFWFSILLIVTAFSGSFGTPLFFFMKEKLKFSEFYLGTLMSVSWVGAIIGSLVYLKYFSKVSYQKALLWAVIINSGSTFFCLLILKYYSAAFFLFLIGGFLSYLTFLPLMASAARLTHGTDVESSLFSILMSVYNLGTIASMWWGGYMFERIGLVWLISLSGAISLLGLLVLKKIRFGTD